MHQLLPVTGGEGITTGGQNHVPEDLHDSYRAYFCRHCGLAPAAPDLSMAGADRYRQYTDVGFLCRTARGFRVICLGVSVTPQIITQGGRIYTIKDEKPHFDLAERVKWVIIGGINNYI